MSLMRYKVPIIISRSVAKGAKRDIAIAPIGRVYFCLYNYIYVLKK